ncbi:hypothetical protein Btru_023856 [Bulinus truncatus]|nr:hypothetical protein Btru_023856 [Bulinus truncatus]
MDIPTHKQGSDDISPGKADHSKPRQLDSDREDQSTDHTLTIRCMGKNGPQTGPAIHCNNVHTGYIVFDLCGPDVRCLDQDGSKGQRHRDRGRFPPVHNSLRLYPESNYVIGQLAGLVFELFTASVYYGVCYSFTAFSGFILLVIYPTHVKPLGKEELIHVVLGWGYYTFFIGICSMVTLSVQCLEMAGTASYPTIGIQLQF